MCACNELTDMGGLILHRIIRTGRVSSIFFWRPIKCHQSPSHFYVGEPIDELKIDVCLNIKSCECIPYWKHESYLYIYLCYEKWWWLFVNSYSLVGSIVNFPNSQHQMNARRVPIGIERNITWPYMRLINFGYNREVIQISTLKNMTDEAIRPHAMIYFWFEDNIEKFNNKWINSEHVIVY